VFFAGEHACGGEHFFDCWPIFGVDLLSIIVALFVSDVVDDLRPGFICLLIDIMIQK
jgi:hypothetical protein